MAEVTREEYDELVTLLLNTQAEVSAIRSVLHALVGAFPDKPEIAFRLSDQLIRLEAELVASIVPDSAIDKTVALLRGLLHTAR